jgi:uncharacterized protein YbjT (DUF2867 family)
VAITVLIVGAGGFVGRHIAGRLAAEGVRVTAAGRDPLRLRRRLPGAKVVGCDLARDDVADWVDRLGGIDAVVNCAGILAAGGDYARVHDHGAAALFDAARLAGVGRVIQISALGADPGATTAYHRSKRAADDHLAAIGGDGTAMGWAVLRPSLVLGRGGASMALFAALAALPAMPRLGAGRWRIQPIHIDDLAEAVVRLVRQSGPLAMRIDMVGPVPLTTDELTHVLRRWLGFGPAPFLPVPDRLLGFVAWLGFGPATPESLAMLRAGNVAPVAPMVAALGFSPRPIGQALARHPAAHADRVAARIAPLAPLLRLLLALVWLAGGIVSLVFTPAAVAGGWLARLGLTGPSAATALWAGSLADIALGVALVARLRGAALAGIALMAGYTAILSIAAPEIWADPFGALVKNLAVLGLSLTVHALETRHG